MNLNSYFSSANAIEVAEGLQKFTEFATNAIGAVQTGIQPDNKDAQISYAHATTDPLAARLINNGVARAATWQVDPCKSGKAKWFLQTPYIVNDTPVGADDDGLGCCVGTPEVQACRYKLGINQLCVKDCVESVLDEMMEQVVKIQGKDTTMPHRSTDDSLEAARRKWVLAYAKFIIERNVILGLPNFSGDGMRPFDGLLSRLTDDRVFTMDGSAGALASIMALECRLSVLGLGVGNYMIAINPILMPTLRQEVRTYLKTDPMTEWRLTPNGVSYNGLEIVASRFVDVNLETNTTSIWLIDTTKVGINLLYAPSALYRKRHESQDDCGGHCMTFHTAGTTVVTNWTGLMLVKNVRLNSVCDSLALSGLDAFVNSGVIGQRFPKVTANPGL